jgi:hypothetical protein
MVGRALDRRCRPPGPGSALLAAPARAERPSSAARAPAGPVGARPVGDHRVERHSLVGRRGPSRRTHRRVRPGVEDRGCPERRLPRHPPPLGRGVDAGPGRAHGPPRAAPHRRHRAPGGPTRGGAPLEARRHRRRGAHPRRRPLPDDGGRGRPPRRRLRIRRAVGRSTGRVGSRPCPLVGTRRSRRAGQRAGPLDAAPRALRPRDPGPGRAARGRRLAALLSADPSGARGLPAARLPARRLDHGDAEPCAPTHGGAAPRHACAHTVGAGPVSRPGSSRARGRASRRCR